MARALDTLVAETAEDELVDVVDEFTGKVIAIMPRSHARAEGKLTWTCQVYLFNKKGDMLIAQRGNVPRFPFYWEIGITETPRSGEEHEHAAARGLAEELGIATQQLPRLSPCFNLYYRNPNNRQDMKNAHVFQCTYNGAIAPDGKEIIRTDFVTISMLGMLISAQGLQLMPIMLKSWAKYKLEILGADGNGCHYKP